MSTFEVRQKLVRLQRLSYLDGLCEIYNRRYYTEHIEQAFGDSRVTILGIIIIDIDCFKEYNDFYGHDMGDRVLQKIAGCLKQGGSERIVACRYGGDEFACIALNARREEVRGYLANFRAKLAQQHIPHIESEVSSCVTVSCGYSVRPKEEIKSLQELFHEADQALYAAKSKGRNRSVCYQEY